MAHYDYRCTSCSHVFEVEHGMTERPALFCPVCGSAAEKVFYASGIEFKGNGYYNTDQRPKSTSSSSSDNSSSCKNCPHKEH
ncbi:FmdB family transcriptional regulator [Collinsella sp. zg1085]|uniref:FmdB family zinc ribbon protein n=1 Tax=Collinsella sp. zg1085 TaxID=2844380 RepID=UPI001C0CCD81|nr:FmdB family zinc ribbon protein [Collinsella sp. zg1085]QWT17140.1 FmdB family transcriptional regulator [Collinsella sp. zg1085]